MNKQHKGPLAIISGNDRTFIGTTGEQTLLFEAVFPHQRNEIALLVASYNVFDEVARELNVDATLLAETINLKKLILSSPVALAYLEALRDRKSYHE